MKKLSLILALTVIIGNYLYSQTWTTYNVENTGLPENLITCLAEDAQGDKWFGSLHHGLSQFDGTIWNVFNTQNSGLVSDMIYDIDIDPQGVLWIGTHEGISRYDGSNWINYDTANSGLVDNKINCLKMDNSGNLWIGTEYGISVFDGNNWTTYNSSNSGLTGNDINVIVEDNQGQYWIGTQYEGAFMFDGINWVKYDVYNSGIVFGPITSIAVDSQNNKWFGSYSNGMSKFDGSNWNTYNSSNSGLPDNSIYSIAIDSQDKKWIGHKDSGISSYDGSNWVAYDTSNCDLTTNDIKSLIIDNSQKKWIATDGGGVFSFDGSNWVNYSVLNTGLINNNTNCSAIDSSGNIWFGTIDGICYYNNNIWNYFNTSNSFLLNNYIREIDFDLNGNMWVLTDNSISMFNGNNWNNYDPTSNAKYYGIEFDLNGDIWVWTNFEGIVKFNGNSWITYNTSNSGLPGNSIRSISIDHNGNKWISTIVNGVAKFDGSNWTVYDTTNSGLMSNTMISSTVDIQNNIWFGSANCLQSFDGNNWSHYDSTDSPVLGGSIGKLEVDALNNIWISSNNGLTKFDGVNWIDYQTSNSGLADNDVTSLEIDNHGNKWVTYWGWNGISKYFDGGPGPLTDNGIVSGIVYHDDNNNETQDSLEQGVANHLIKLEPGPYYSTTDANGRFSFSRPEGNYTISYIPSQNWSLTTDSSSYSIFLPDSTNIDTLVFGTKANINVQDNGIYYTSQQARMGFTINYWINYKNWGTITSGDTIKLEYDSLLTHISSGISPDYHSGNVMKWRYDTLASGEQRCFHMRFEVPGVQYLDSSLTSICSINPIANDTNISNNYDTLSQVITGSYDPNDKLVTPSGKGQQGYILHGSDLTYTIRFQNTGTDTAFNIVIRDTLDPYLDVETFTLLASSHTVDYDITGQGIITFNFDDIMLPDSNVNEPASNGFVKFSVSPDQGLSDFTEVTNEAYIYFDFNPPILTNETLNTYVSQIPVSIDHEKERMDVTLYPNPTKDKIYLQSNNKIKNIEIYNLNGQLLYNENLNQSFDNQSRYEVNLSEYPQGIYIIKVQTKDDMKVGKIIKQ